MATILHIETSTSVCSVAISINGELIFNQIETEGPSHAVKLPLFIDTALKFIKSEQLTLEAVAVSSGPGSYTGLRIGVSTAKGLCYGLDIPLIAVDTLAIIATQAINNMPQNIIETNFMVVPMIDARRMEVYTGIYDKDLQLIEPIEAKIIDESSYAKELNQGTLYFCGNGAGKCKTTLTHPNAHFIDDVVPLAENMIILAEKAYNNGNFENVAYYEPFYLKEFQATTPKKKF